MDLLRQLGFTGDRAISHSIDPKMVEYANLKLAAMGAPTFGNSEDYPWLELGRPLLSNYHEMNRHLRYFYCPVDQYVQDFLTDYLSAEKEFKGQRWLPEASLVLDRHGLARAVSLPPDGDVFESAILKSYRVEQGICHNPDKDKRTTEGVFHVAEGGLPIPMDKKAVPELTFGRLLKHALQAPAEMMELPFTSTQEKKAYAFVSLLLRPVMCPEVAGVLEEKKNEVRFFVPGSLVANLDFVESIFGNAGDPFLLENDARMDVHHWSGHTGCVILAPHLITLRKKDLGLPHVNEATDRQKRDGMCWEDPEEKYNEGGAFKITCRDHRGVMVTVIADNYFGYCKKEVKTQISYAANLYGLCEEEHAGGAIAFPSFDLGEDFKLSDYFRESDHTWQEVVDRYGDVMDVQPDGYGIDKTYPDIIYVPEDVHISLSNQILEWGPENAKKTLKLQKDTTYILPSGYKVEMNRPSTGFRFRLTGTIAEGTHCHKPCTVSGGGKSEISKAITDAMVAGSVIIQNFSECMKAAEAVINYDYSHRYRNPTVVGKKGRALLSADRSLGSVVKLLTQNLDFTPEYNSWVASIPQDVRNLVMVVKTYYKPHWGDTWKERFTVDHINGKSGNELKYRKEKVTTRYVRVGFREGSWRLFTLRKDFAPAHKIQTQDDITATVVVPRDKVRGALEDFKSRSLKFVKNCEYRLFQRPDEAIVRGYDKTAESDFSRSGNFFSNYEPLARDQAQQMVEDAIHFDLFSEPLQNLIHRVSCTNGPGYFISTAHPRLVDGERTKNPRYLQNRSDLEHPRDSYLAVLGARFHRRLELKAHVPVSVHSVLVGRRNNPPVPGIRPLAVYNPIHYQDLPEAFMDFVASLTGKSPSTTGAGSEGALTKGPFNALPAVIDLNNALVSYLITGMGIFSTAAGYVGPKYKVDHDVSLLVPEIWSRMYIDERDPDFLKENGFIEKVEDFDHKGQRVLASRLGYRITDRFCGTFIGRMFSEPLSVFDSEMLRPELQDLESFVDGVNNIVETQKKIALNYFDDGTVEMACPPLKALLHIMAYGEWEGKTADDPVFRALFTFDHLVGSDWYRERLVTCGRVKQNLLERHRDYLNHLLQDDRYAQNGEAVEIETRLVFVENELKASADLDPVKEFHLTLGTDPGLYPAHSRQP